MRTLIIRIPDTDASKSKVNVIHFRKKWLIIFQSFEDDKTDELELRRAASKSVHKVARGLAEKMSPDDAWLLIVERPLYPR